MSKHSVRIYFPLNIFDVQKQRFFCVDKRKSRTWENECAACRVRLGFRASAFLLVILCAWEEPKSRRFISLFSRTFFAISDLTSYSSLSLMPLSPTTPFQEREKQTDRHRSSICLLTPQMAATAAAGWVWNKKPGASLWCLTWVQGPRTCTIVHYFPRRLARGWVEEWSSWDLNGR